MPRGLYRLHESGQSHAASALSHHDVSCALSPLPPAGKTSIVRKGICVLTHPRPGRGLVWLFESSRSTPSRENAAVQVPL